MNITILAHGSRGDIQPYIALGKGLLRAGYEAALCTSEGYRSLVEKHGLHYIFLDRDLLRLTQGVLGETHSGDTFAMLKQMLPAIQTTMGKETMRRCAAELGEKIRAEDGVARAVAVIGALLNPPARRE